MRIIDLKNQFLGYLVEYRGRTANTRKAYDFDLSKFINFIESKGITDIQQVTTETLENYLFQLKTSTVTKARMRSSIKSFFNFLSRRKYIQGNPASILESIKIPEKSPEYLSQEQSDILIKTIEKEATPFYQQRDLVLIKLLLKTGLRRAEIVGLNIDDIDFSKLRLRVKRKGNRIESVIIHHELVNDLQSYLKANQRNSDSPLFLSKRGKRLSASSVWHLVKTYSFKAGLNGNVTVHSLRHTFATTLLSKSMPLPYIQALLGHKNSQTTSRYLHLQNNELTEAFNKVSFERG